MRGGVAVGRGAGDLSGREPAIGAGLVLDDHRLAQRVAQAVAQRACNEVDRAARRLRKNEADGLGRIGFVGTRAFARRRDQHKQRQARQRSRDPTYRRNTFQATAAPPTRDGIVAARSVCAGGNGARNPACTISGRTSSFHCASSSLYLTQEIRQPSTPISASLPSSSTICSAVPTSG